MSSNYCGLVKDIPGALDDTDDEVRSVVCHAIIDFLYPFLCLTQVWDHQSGKAPCMMHNLHDLLVLDMDASVSCEAKVGAAFCVYWSLGEGRSWRTL